MELPFSEEDESGDDDDDDDKEEEETKIVLFNANSVPRLRQQSPPITTLASIPENGTPRAEDLKEAHSEGEEEGEAAQEEVDGGDIFEEEVVIEEVEEGKPSDDDDSSEESEEEPRTVPMDEGETMGGQDALDDVNPAE